MMFKITVPKLFRTWMAVWLMFAFLGAPMQVRATGIAIDVNASVSDQCVNQSQSVGGPNDNGTSKNPRLCTPTSINSPPSMAILTYIPIVTVSLMNTATATSTPTNTATPTVTSTPTNTATPTTVPQANITVYNTGSFFVHYYVSYNLPNAPLQSLYSGVFNINQGVTLTIPGNATNVGILVQHYTGITGWQTTCTRSYTQARSVVIIVSGTTFSPSCTGG